MPSSYIRKRTAKKRGKESGKFDRWLAVFEFKDTKTGKRATISQTFEFERDAKAWKKTMEAKKDPRGQFVKPTKDTVGEWLDTWLEEVAGPQVEESTLRSYREITNLYLRPGLENIPLANLSTEFLQGWINRLAKSGGKNGKPLGPTTVSYARNVLRIALRVALVWKRISENPLEGVKLPKAKNGTKKAKSRADSMTLDEVRRFLAALDGQAFGPLFTMLLYTGARPGEMFASRWIDVLDLDGEAPKLHLWRSVQIVEDGRAIIVERTKTDDDDGREVYLDPEAVRTLKAHKLAAKKAAIKAKGRSFGEEDLIFPAKGSSDVPLDIHNVRRAYRRILKDAGITKKITTRDAKTKTVAKFRLYDLRHTYASIMIAQGVDLKTVSESLGHADPAFTVKTYQHVLDETRREARGVFGAAVNGE